MGEGGAVNVVGSALLSRIVESLRDWGRYCCCPSGRADTCGNRTDCGWSGFLLLVLLEAPFASSELGCHLAAHRVGSLMLFSGNLLRQPDFVTLRKEWPEALRLAVSTMAGADRLMEQALFLGTYPGLSEAMIDHEIELIRRFVVERRGLRR
jgi:CDP-6-deoxy-D-xylo-4-hexulose-3-dehydrase